MRQIFIINILLALLCFLSACENKNEPTPKVEIVITTEKESVNIGESLSINYTINSSVDISTINILIDNKIVENVNNTIGSKTYQGVYNFIAKTEYLNKKALIQVEVIDAENERSTEGISIRVGQSSEPVPILEYNNIILETQSINNAKQFLDADLGKTFTLLEGKSAASTIDLVAFYDDEKKWIIAAPDDQVIRDFFTDEQNGTQTWSVRNRTRLKETALTNRDFFAITDGKEIRGEYALGGTPQNTDTQDSFALQVNNLQAGYVFAFQTVDEKEGLIYISEIVGEAAGRTTIAIKIIK